MYKNKLFIFVCCGAGKLTSYMAEEGIKKGLKAAGMFDGIHITHGMMGDISRWSSNIDILVASSNYKGKHDFPVLNGTSFVTMDKNGQDELIKQIIELIKEKKK